MEVPQIRSCCEMKITTWGWQIYIDMCSTATKNLLTAPRHNLADPHTNYKITGGFINTINYMITILCRTATESPRQQRLPRRCGVLRQPLRSAPLSAVHGGRAAPPSCVLLESVHGDPLPLSAHQHFEGLLTRFRYGVRAGVWRCEQRQRPASPDVHPSRLLE